MNIDFNGTANIPKKFATKKAEAAFNTLLGNKNVIDSYSLSVKQGLNDALEQIRANPYEYVERGSVATKCTNGAKSKMMSLSYEKLFNDVRVINSYGVHYFIVRGKMIIIVKKFDKKGRPTNISSKRYSSLYSDNVLSLSKKANAELEGWGIINPLPVIFLGYTLSVDSKNIRSLSACFIEDNAVQWRVNCFDVSEQNTPNLFTLPSKERKEENELVTPKKWLEQEKKDSEKNTNESV